MSTDVPPISSESNSEARGNAEVERLKREVARLNTRLNDVIGRSPNPFDESQSIGHQARPSATSFWIPSAITAVLQGFTLIGVVAFAFWFGGVSKTIDTMAEDIRTLKIAVSGSKESLGNRMSVVETKLDNVDQRLDNVDQRLDSIDKKLDQLAKRP